MRSDEVAGLKKFKFQLAALLKVTKMKKEQAEIAFAEAVQNLEIQRKALADFEAELKQGMEDYYYLQNDKITVDRLMSYGTYFDRMRKQIASQEEVIVVAEERRTACLELLKATMNKLKSIEQLKEKRFAEFKSQQLFEEQKELDEIGLQLYTRVR